MKKLVKIIVLVMVFAFSACSSDNSDDLGVANTILEGKVFGESFAAKGGQAFLVGTQTSGGQSSDGELNIYITNIVADCSSDVFDYTLYVSTYVENKVGLTTQANVVFGKKGETPLNVLQSTVVVESISDSEIKGKIKASSNSGENIIEGTFVVPFCK